jgi:hypothetical protein
VCPEGTLIATPEQGRFSTQSRPDCNQLAKEDVMGKYFLAWLLGVPAGVLVLVYLFTHL